MSNMISTDTWPVKLMRWAARFLSIAWAFWALFITFFLAHHLSSPASIIIPIIAVLMYMGAAIVASVWKKEAFGGGWLLADSVLVLAFFIVFAFLTGSPGKFFWDQLTLPATVVLPPLVAGSLFLACHRQSKTPANVSP